MADFFTEVKAPSKITPVIHIDEFLNKMHGPTKSGLHMANGKMDVKTKLLTIDVRAPVEYTKGHIPGAINLPFTLAIDSLGKLKKAEDLRKILTNYFEDTKEVIGMCGSGVTAAIINLALDRIGKSDHSLYDGSWTEWGMYPTVPVETGDA